MIRALLLAALFLAPAAAQTLPKFMGRAVTLTTPELDEDGFFPKGPASVCIEGPPQKQCYTAPADFGRSPTVEVVMLAQNTPALFFSADSGGVSGVSIHFALLVPGRGSALNNLFFSDMSVSNQSQHAFWTQPAISGDPVFVTADYVVGLEAHYEPHRYMISAYVRRPSSIVDGLYYSLQDRYMTVVKYDLDAKADVLASERPEILARLKRVVAAQKLH